MVKQVHILLELLVVVAVVYVAIALPTPDEERYVDKEYNRELINWLTSLQYPEFNLCKYYTGAMPKRNSELINSLLSLPNDMNIAGKK